jgi:hypothetical protein
VIPAPLSMPLLPRSERRVPPWVLATIVLFRLEGLLDQLERRFEITTKEQRGTLAFASRSQSTGHRASLPTAERRIELVLVGFPLSTRLLTDALTLMPEEIIRVAA